MLNAEEVFRNYHDKIQYFILGKVSDYYVAEDLTSKVFMKMLEKQDTFDESKAAVSTWIYTIASNTVIDYYRTHKIHEEVPEDLVSDNSEVDEEILNNETLEELASALERLTERERDLIIMHYYHNMTLKEAAIKLGMSYANVKIVHNKAIVKLRGFMPNIF